MSVCVSMCVSVRAGRAEEPEVWWPGVMVLPPQHSRFRLGAPELGEAVRSACERKVTSPCGGQG